MANKKLTEQQIIEIIDLYGKGETMKNLASRYDVHQNTIASLIRRNGLSKTRRGKGEYGHLSITIDKGIIDQLAQHRGLNISKLISSLLEKWVKRNVPNLRPN